MTARGYVHLAHVSADQELDYTAMRKKIQKELIVFDCYELYFLSIVSQKWSRPKKSRQNVETLGLFFYLKTWKFPHLPPPPKKKMLRVSSQTCLENLVQFIDLNIVREGGGGELGF